MFGVNLALRWPFYIAIVSAGIGSMVTSILGIKAGKLGAAGYLGFPSIEATVGAGIPGFLGCLVLTTVIAFVASFIWGKKVESGNTEEAEAPAVPAATEASTEAPSVASAEASGEGVELGAHLVGTVLPLVDVKDPTFSSGALGAGIAVEPTEGKLYAPADGKITVAFPTGHAYGLRTEDGLEPADAHRHGHRGAGRASTSPRMSLRATPSSSGDVIAEFDIPAIRAAATRWHSAGYHELQEAGRVGAGRSEFRRGCDQR